MEILKHIPWRLQVPVHTPFQMGPHHVQNYGELYIILYINLILNLTHHGLAVSRGCRRSRRSWKPPEPASLARMVLADPTRGSEPSTVNSTALAGAMGLVPSGIRHGDEMGRNGMVEIEEEKEKVRRGESGKRVTPTTWYGWYRRTVGDEWTSR